MRGIATIIAVILMVLLAIALGSLTVMFIMGYFKRVVAVVLTITEARCNTTHFMVDVRNDGTDASGVVTVTIINATGAEISGAISSILPTHAETAVIFRATGFDIPPLPPYYQLYRIRATTPGARPATSQVLC